ncbi:MAG: ribosome maturation factor RimM [Acidimicrobiales bacterium]
MSDATPAAAGDLLEVGRITRPHGLKGGVVVDLVTDRVAERTAPGAVLWAGERRLEVVTAQPHQGSKWLVAFAGVTSREEADRLHGRVLRAEPIDDPDALFVHELIGRTVVDQHGKAHGPVVSVVANPASDLLELADGRLVPMVFVTGSADDEVSVTVPAGLLDDDDDGA